MTEADVTAAAGAPNGRAARNGGVQVAAVDCFRASLMAGSIAGLLLWAVEAVDRAVVLRGSLAGLGELLDLAVQSALLAPAVLAAGAILALALVAVMRVSALTRRSTDVRRSWIVPVAAVAALVVPVVLAGSTPVARGLVQRLAYFLHLDKAAEHGVLTALLPLAFVASLLLAAPATAALLQGRLARHWVVLLCCGFIAMATCAYYVDSRWVVGLHDSSVHMMLGLATVAATFGACFVVICAVSNRRKLLLRVAIVCLAVSALGSVVALTRLNRNPRVAALFWTRGVLSQRTAALAEWLVDADGDGFSAAVRGGDTDDSLATVNPLARDVPGDGIDQNGVGGDAVAGAPDVTDSRYFGEALVPPGNGRRNVIFISIDTLRADHLSGYGYSRATSPEIDAFARGGATFLHAEAQGTSTGHSFASMMSGAYGDRIFATDQPRLGAVLSQMGYSTPFVNSAPSRRFINRDDTWLYYRDLMSTGFEPRDAAEPHFRRAAELVDDTISLLKEVPAGKSVFLWFHLRDPHAGYTRHADFDFGRRPIDRYDSEIAYTDHHLGRFFEYLREGGWLEDSLVIVTSDHGESFGEHGDYSHHRRPYRSLAHVPLIVHWPGAPGSRVESAAGAIDIAPTIAHWAGVQGMADRFDGIDLRWQAARPEGELADRAVVCETPRNCREASFLAWSLRQGRYRLIYDVVGPRVELFDVEADPREEHNLAGDLPEETRRMMDLLGRFLDRMSLREGYSGWAQMQPSLFSPARQFPELPESPDRRQFGDGPEEDPD